MVRRGQSKAEPPSVVADLLIKQKTEAGSVSFLEALLGSSDAWERSSQHTNTDSAVGSKLEAMECPSHCPGLPSQHIPHRFVFLSHHPPILPLTAEGEG